MAQASAANRLGKTRRPPLGRFPFGAFLRSSGPSLALGLLIALLLQLIARLPGAPPASPDASPASRATWSVLVCVSLGLATALVRRVLFPGGCALVVWTVDRHRQTARRSRAAADQAG